MVRSIFQSNSAWIALILLCCLFFTHPFCKASGSHCFTNEGTLEIRDYPCNPTQSESFCCGIGWACLPNRLCAPTASVKATSLGRGSCTDKLWASTSQCPSFCLGTPDSRNGGLLVIQCGDPNTFCCGYDTSCNCTTGTGTIRLSGGFAPFTTIGVVQSSTQDSQSIVTVTATESAKKTEIETTTERTTERTTELVTETVSTTPSPSISSLSSTETSSTSTEPLSTNTLSNVDSLSNLTSKATPESKEGIKIGVGVGVSLGALIIASIGIFAFWRERRLKKHMEDLRSRWLPVESYLNQRGVSTAVQPSSMNHSHDADLAMQPVSVNDWDRR